jgi:hypothetical protein
LTPDELFPTENQLVIWIGENKITLTWDSERRDFVQPERTKEPPAIDATPDDLFSCARSDEATFFCGYNADYDIALQLSDVVIANPPEIVDDDTLMSIHYLRALALEALNRPDDALAEYIAIYESVPDSAWGLLAALHLETING